jgi:rhamnogalacturonyl hydrolase YesR
MTRPAKLVVLLCGVLASEALSQQDDIVDTMRLVADHYLEHDSNPAACGWEHSTFLKGLMAMSRAEQQLPNKYNTYAMRWGTANSWTCCNYPELVDANVGANDMLCGSTYADIYMGRRNDTYILNTRTVLEAIITRPSIADWWWVESYFMAMGTFARIGSIMRDDKFHDKSFAMYNDSAVRRGLRSKQLGLYFRDESRKNTTSQGGTLLFWGRGTGLAMAALAEAIRFSPPTHPARQVYSAHLLAAAEAARTLQRADGMWQAALLDTATGAVGETSATAAILYAIGAGINVGVLPEEVYQPVVDRAWDALVKLSIRGDGFVGFCEPAYMPDGRLVSGPQPAAADNSGNYCAGLVLLAGSEVFRLAY